MDSMNDTTISTLENTARATKAPADFAAARAAHARVEAVKVTSINLYSLGQHFGENDEATNKLRPTAYPHIARCLKAGLVEVANKTTLRLTSAGRIALGR